MKKPVALIIMDGFGESKNTDGNAIASSNTPNLNNDNSLYNNNSKNTTQSEETSNNKSLELEYPDELNNDLLHSYNEPTIKPRYLNNSVNAVDVLRNFDLSLDYSINESRKNSCTEEEVNNIFSKIENDHSGILATMKAYRIPYPIAKILIKKIIKISLENNVVSINTVNPRINPVANAIPVNVRIGFVFFWPQYWEATITSVSPIASVICCSKN